MAKRKAFKSKASRPARKRAQPANVRFRVATQRGEEAGQSISGGTTGPCTCAGMADDREHKNGVVRGFQSRQAIERTTENSEVVCSLDLSNRAQRMQQAWFRVLDSSLSLAVRGPAVLSDFKSVAELVSAQQKLYFEVCNNVAEWGTRLLQIAGPRQPPVRPPV